MANETVAVLGTGIMGAPMARNAARAGLSVRAWNRTSGKAQALAGDGVEVAASPAEAVRGTEVIVTMLPTADIVADVLERAAAGLTDGAVWVQASTVGVAGCARLAETARRRGLAFLDAPVLGTRQPAEQGQLTVLAAGDEDGRRAAAPFWEAVAARTVWLGPQAGAASRLKLALNAWVVAITEGAAETLALARALGIDGERVLDALRGGSLDSPYLQMKGKAMLAGDFEPSFPLALAHKDAELILEAAQAADLDLPLARGVAEAFGRAVQAGHGRDDMAAVYATLVPAG
jgi:3-hydroxyisobutyrate dehydrogenase